MAMSETGQFEHGDTVTFAAGVRSHGRSLVHCPPWWNLWAHVRWLVALLQKRTSRMTLTDGSDLRLLEEEPASRFRVR